MQTDLAVVIPTRDRPDKLQTCLDALVEAHKYIDFAVHVCDSSPDAKARGDVVNVCKRFPFVQLHFHEGKNIAASKNFCARIADEPLLINVDDDVNVEPEAILALYRRYTSTPGWAVICGSVFWGSTWDGPFVLRPIGYGRPPRPGEKPSFLLGAFFLYPKALAEFLPWNERFSTSEDIFMGALWRSHNVSLVGEPAARAVHNRKAPEYGLGYVDGMIYANLFDTLIANRNLLRAAMYEFLGFAAGAKRYFRSLTTARDFVAAWYRGHAYLLRDRAFLDALVSKRLPCARDGTAPDPGPPNPYVPRTEVC